MYVCMQIETLTFKSAKDRMYRSIKAVPKNLKLSDTQSHRFSCWRRALKQVGLCL